MKHLRTRESNVNSAFGPDAVTVEQRMIRTDDGVSASFVVTGYPREVRAGWLDPLFRHSGSIDVAVHVEPVAPVVAADTLRKQLARLQSTQRIDDKRERLVDFDVEVAAQDATDLARRVARGDARLFKVGLLVTVRAVSESELASEVDHVRATLGTLLVEMRPTTFRALQGWIATLPFGIDDIDMTRTFDTPALAATFPFPAAELSEASGVLYGRNSGSSGLVFWDRFAQDNFNSVILARSGAGKSYLAKLEVLRSLYLGIDVSVVDPEDEYERLCGAVEGAYVQLGARGVRLNPFDLGPTDDALNRQVLFLHSLISSLVGRSLDAEEATVLDRVLLATYGECGINGDQRTHRRQSPTLVDLTERLIADNDDLARGLGRQLMPFASGSAKGLFDGQTTVRPEGHLVVYSLRDVPEELKAAATMVTLDRIWQQVSDPQRRKRRMVTVDEAWLIMADPAGARFLYRLAKSARKYWCGLTTVTQDSADLLGTDLGRAVVANAATQILLRQAPQAIDMLAESFKLSSGERSHLMSAQRGSGIMCAGTTRVAFDVIASPGEHRVITTDAAELAGGDL